MQLSLMPDYRFGDLGYKANEIRRYVESQAKDERVTFLEKVKTEPLLGRKMDVWNVHTNQGAWWVITNPTNLYSQKLFPSMDYTISFHVGVTTRMMGNTRNDMKPSTRRRLLSPARRLEEATDAMALANEAEELQSVGVRLRETLLEFIQIVSDARMVPPETEAPKRADFMHWSELVADTVARGSSASEARTALKATARSAWQFANWLAHAKNAVQADAQIALELVRATIGTFWAAVEKYEAGAPDRCPNCGSYRVHSDYRPDLGIDPPYIKLCERCDWIEPNKAPPANARNRIRGHH
jgi:hypothetical protein